VLQQTHSTTAGLSRQDAKQSLSEYGANSLKQKQKSTALILLLNQFKSPIILILIFAAVRSIFLQEAASAIFGDTQPDFYKPCLCNALLRFANGFVPEGVYGKRDIFEQSENIFTIYGAEETLVFTPESCQLMQGENRQAIEVGTRRGLFAQDTDMVLKYLSTCTHLYVNNPLSLYALKVADAARRSSKTGRKVGRTSKP